MSSRNQIKKKETNKEICYVIRDRIEVRRIFLAKVIKKSYQGTLISSIMDLMGINDDQRLKNEELERDYDELFGKTPEEYYKEFQGAIVTYKGKVEGYVAGFVEHYLILGFDNERGCIKTFSPQVVYDEGYKSYRFSKMKNIVPF